MTGRVLTIARTAIAVGLVTVISGAAVPALGDRRPAIAPSARLVARHRAGPGARRRTASTPSPPRVGVSVPANARVTAVPASFLGLSTEYWAVPVWARHVPQLTRVLAALRTNGPVQLRVGGDSADHVFWSPPRASPDWMFGVTPRWLRGLAGIARRSHVRLVLDLNLVTASLHNATRWASAAVAQLPPGSLAGFEIGNEADIYSHRSWQSMTLGGIGARVLPARMTATDYAGSFGAYARALATAAPGVPLLGPALAEPQLNLGWVSRLLASPHPALSAVTVHRYPLSACATAGSSTYPSIARVLGPRATVGMARSVAPAVRLAATAGLPLRLTEINSVTCGGTSGVSNSFATALWAPDALLRLIGVGVASADIHVRVNAINAAFTFNRHGLVARPLLYGMIMFSRMLSPGSRLVGLRLHNPGHVHLQAWGVRSPGNVMRVMLIDTGHRPARTGLGLAVAGRATVQRLTGPSARATSGVTLNGQWLDAHGRWRGRAAHEVVTPGHNGVQLTVAPMSAALVTAHLRPAPLGRSPGLQPGVTRSGPSRSASRLP